MTRFLLRAAMALAAIPVKTTAAQPPREGHVAAEDGIRLFYRVEGSGPVTVIAPADLYLHPGLRGLATGRRVVFYDMRNRGRSDRVADSSHITIEWDVRDLETVRRHVGAEKVGLIGWSYLGLMVMLYTLEHPDRVERVAQIGPVPRRWDTRFPRELTAHDAAPLYDSTTRAEIARLQSDTAPPSPLAHCERLNQLTRVGLVGDRALADRVPSVCALQNELPRNFNRHLRHHFLGSVQHLDVPWDRIRGITQPVLTIHGTQDRNAAYGGGREWVEHLPNARLLTVRGAAHMPWLDQPNTVVRALDAFFSGRWPASAERVLVDPLQRELGAVTFDAVTLLGHGVIAIGCTIAAWLPARKAAMLDTAAVLRAD